MEKITKPYRDVAVFVAHANKILAESKTETKFMYYLAKVAKSAERLTREYNEKVQELDIDHASEDDKGNLLKDQHGELVFTKAAMKKRNTERSELFEQDVEVGRHLVERVPEGLSSLQRAALTDFIIPDTEPEA